MYRATKPTLSRGMRRILKRRGPIPEYIRQAVESGTYRSSEELAQMKSPADSEDARKTAARLRFNLVRGSSIQDYPAEYVILQQHPPLPDPPRTPQKIQHQRQPKQNERIESLVHKYYHRHQHHHHHNHEHEQDNYPRRVVLPKKQPKAAAAATTGAAQADEAWNPRDDTDWYYRQLLGIPKPSDADSGNAALLSTKSVALRQAYNAAVHHYQLERSNGDGMSQKEIMQTVDALLAAAQEEEKTMAATMAQQAQAWRQGAGNANVVQQQQQAADKVATTTQGADSKKEMKIEDYDAPEQQREQNWLATLQSNPRTWQALQRWSDRLQAVPYGQWTVGASTALDHWIAVTVLGVSEDTWQAVLQGQDESTQDIGPAIVAVRQALFPETILDGQAMSSSSSSMESDDDLLDYDDLVDSGNDQDGGTSGGGDDDEAGGNLSLDELLAELGSLSESVPVENVDDIANDAEEPASSSSSEDRMIVMTEELQDWRRQKQEGSLDETTFYGWSRRYMETLGIDKNSISYEDFAKVILEDPPLDRRTSDEFWDRLSTRAGAEELAMELSSNTALADMAARFGLQPGDAEGLWNVAALRPLLDEYAPEADRQAFLTKYGDILLEGMPLEHLEVTPDRGGHHEDTVAARSLPNAWAATLPATARVRVKTLAFRSNVDDDLYALWKEHKAGRARYEEKLFRTKRLGLLYGEEDKDEEDDDEF